MEQHSQSRQPEHKWYMTNWGAIVLLALFFPVGIYLMWRYTDWPKRTKWIVTGGFAVFTLLVGLLGGQTDTAGVTAQTTPTPKPSNIPSSTPTPTPKPTPTQDTLPQEPKARIEAIIKKQGDFEIDLFNSADANQPATPPYEVIINQKDYTEWQDKCTEAKDKAFHIQRTLYTDPIAMANIARVLVNLRPVLSVSLGGDDGRAITDWGNASGFYANINKSGLSQDSEEGVPMQKRTWAAGNQYSGFGACKF